MSDPGTTDHNDNSKAEARFDSVSKANIGNTSNLAEPFNANKISAVEVYKKEKEKQDTDTETEEEVEDEKVEKEEMEEEVKIIDKIRGKG